MYDKKNAPYKPDLAFIHDEGFGQLATSAAGLVTDKLNRSGVMEGTIIDLGCGSGITAQLLSKAGYSVIGIDISEAMIGIAKKRVPDATFLIGSFIEADLAPCITVTAIGEVLNYAFDSRNGSSERNDLFRRIFKALVPGGFFIFDIAGPERMPSKTTKKFIDYPGWTLLVETSAEDEMLSRRIISFRRIGELYRRNEEKHLQYLIPPDQIESELLTLGFMLKDLIAMEKHLY